MSESIHAVALLLCIAGTIVGAMAWLMGQPDPVIWTCRIAGILGVGLGLGLIWTLHSRKDLAVDFLRLMWGSYLCRDGFGIGFYVMRRGRTASMDVYFQNQYDQPCRGRFGIRPGRNFWMDRPSFQPPAIQVEVECEPAALGIVRVPLGIPLERQGRTQSFEVGLSVEHPFGRGRRVRFHDGTFVRTTADFRNHFNRFVAPVALLGGRFMWTTPVTVSVELPVHVDEFLAADARPQVFTLWKWGDPLLTTVKDAVEKATGESFDGAFVED